MTRNNHIWPFLIIAGWVWVITPSKLMGKMFPVVSEVSIHVQPHPDNAEWVDADGSFLKLREDCRPLRMEWVLGTRLIPGPPIEYIWGKPEVRLLGKQVFEDWSIRAAPVSVFEEDTFSDVIHKCAIVIGDIRVELPWETRTAFWN